MHYRLHRLLILSCTAYLNILFFFLRTPPNCLLLILQKTYWPSLVSENARQKAYAFSGRQAAGILRFARVKESGGRF